MMKKQAMFAKYILIISSLLLFACKKTEEERLQEIREKSDKRGWTAEMSSPFYYPCIGQHIYFFNKGKIIANAATLTSIGSGWHLTGGSRGSGGTKIFPDSVYVTYTGLNEKNQMFDYEGGMSLPEKKIEALYKKKYLKDGSLEKFDDLIVGMAPGGRICVWLDHVEIKRGKVKEYAKFKNSPSLVSGDSVEIHKYLYHHPVDYSFWDKPDPRYELDFGFCSENGQCSFALGIFYTKEGIQESFSPYFTDDTKWGIPCNAPVDNEVGGGYQQINEVYNSHKMQLPVHINMGWENHMINKFYSTDIVLPKNFAKRFTKPYINHKTGKKSNYHRLVFGVEKDGEYCIIWLDGPDKQEKLMRFKGQLSVKDRKTLGSDYATEVTYY